MTIYTNTSLTTIDRKIITACLSDYRDLCDESAGDVNIMGIAYDKLQETVAATIARVKADMMYADDLMVINNCFGDAIDQFDISNGECGFIQSEDDRAAVTAICYKLHHNTKKYVMLQAADEKLTIVLADLLLGHYGADISDYDITGRNYDTCVWNYLSDLGMTPGEDIECDVAVTAWAMAILGIRDLTDGANRDKVYDLAAKLSEIA